jgi:hypothetical protein
MGALLLGVNLLTVDLSVACIGGSRPDGHPLI